MKPTFEILTGRTDSHIALLPDGKTRLHQDILKDFAKLAEKSAKDGFPIQVVSSYRDFATQLRIWNEKCEGKRALVDAEGNPLDPSKLSAEQIVSAILRWSALPGASRHHWGTDFDVVAAGFPEDYKVQLTPKEIEPGGVFEAFGAWLEETLPFAGFYRPYYEERGGVSPEWWHLSYAPLAEKFRKTFTLAMLKKSVEETDLRLKGVVQKSLKQIYEKYIDNVTEPEG